MSKPADPLRQLARLARVAEPGGRNIGSHLKRHAAALAQALDVPELDLLAAAREPDEILAPKVQASLRGLQDAQRAARSGQDTARAIESARRLEARARWEGGAVLLDPALVLGALLADQQRPHLLFALHDGTAVAVLRRDLAACARVVGRRCDLTTFVDAAGLHLRWSAGRGGLNWYPRPLTPTEREQALRVDLPGPQLPMAPARAKARPRSWTWDVMADLALAT